jgi:hypothetical protein
LSAYGRPAMGPGFLFSWLALVILGIRVLRRVCALSSVTREDRWTAKWPIGLIHPTRILSLIEKKENMFLFHFRTFE